MKILKYVLSIAFLVFAIYSCSEDDSLVNIDGIAAPKNVSASVRVTQDNTGLVTITPLGEGVTNFDLTFGDGSLPSEGIRPGSSLTHIFEEGSYNLIIKANGLNGLSTSVTQPLVVSFQAPQNLLVTIENDPTISKKVNVTAEAEFAVYYDVDFGDGSAAVEGNNGDTVSYIYQNAGVYTITVTAYSAAIENTSYTEEFEVTAILQPLQAAPTPPARSDDDVISVFSDAYTDIAGTDFYPNWGQSTTFNQIAVGGSEIIQYGNLNYQGIQLGTPADASAMEFLHIDIWTADDNEAKISPISPGPNETAYDLDLTPQQWTSFNIPLSFFTDQNPLVNLADIIQFKFDGNPAGGTIFIDNLYFYKAAPTSGFDDGLLTNGDFENGSDSWIVGVNDNAPAPVVTDGGNTYYSVDVTVAGNPYDVNLSQKLEIIQGETYTLTFDAWSDVNRSIIAGIGLSGGDFSNTNETVNITPTVTNYTLTLTATSFGAVDARVLFDLGAVIGIVNIDNVSLKITIENLLTNGDFENGNDSWIVGVDDNAPAPVVTDGGNTYYSVNVAVAGNPWEVNLSQKLEIIQGETYTLTFDAWSNLNRSIIAGIGLSGGDFSNTNETVNISPTVTNYTLTLTATSFGAADARVLFDLGAVIGIVNIDNVVLTVD